VIQPTGRGIFGVLALLYVLTLGILAWLYVLGST
jgi:hypothetical protein